MMKQMITSQHSLTFYLQVHSTAQKTAKSKKDLLYEA